MSYKVVRFKEVELGKEFYYQQQRWVKRESTRGREPHNAHTTDGSWYKLFSPDTKVSIARS